MPPKLASKTAPGSAQKNKVRKTVAAPAAADGTPTKAQKTKGAKQSKVAKTTANVQRTSYPPPTRIMSALHNSTCAIPQPNSIPPF